ncbi:MAG: glycosyltransferase [Polyangiaceae bacterium]|nr:glycosyltransferase [Polyangiaceae bacterium]
MRVLVVSPSMARGGAQRFAATLVAHLDRSRFSPELALMRNDIAFPLPEDVPVHGLGYDGPATGPAIIHRLAGLISKLRPQLLLSTLTSANIITGCALRLTRMRPRWVARIGTSPRYHDGVARKLFSHAFVRDADQFAPNSLRMQRELEYVYPFARGRTTMIPNPADFEFIDTLANVPWEPTATERPIILAVGRLQLDKRPDLLLKVFEWVRRKVDAELWIAGDGNLLTTTRTQLADLGLEPHVKLLGFQKNPFALMRKATIMLTTSDHEGSPNAVIEAQGLGLPVVATHAGGEEVIDDGVTGLLAPAGDVAALAAATVTLLQDAALRARMSAAASERIRQRFDTRQIIPRWEALFETVCSQ